MSEIATYSVAQHDTSPAVTDTLEDSTGTAVNLTGAAVKFHMTDWTRSTVVVNASATGPAGGALDSTGRVQYQWLAADVANAGVFLAEWQVMFASGAIETWPNDGPAIVSIEADLA